MEASRAGGWTAGDYTLEVFLDDRLSQTESFRVAGADRGSQPQQGADRPGH
jgi:hypothetical protein